MSSPGLPNYPVPVVSPSPQLQQQQQQRISRHQRNMTPANLTSVAAMAALQSNSPPVPPPSPSHHGWERGTAPSGPAQSLRAHGRRNSATLSPVGMESDTSSGGSSGWQAGSASAARVRGPPSGAGRSATMNRSQLASMFDNPPPPRLPEIPPPVLPSLDNPPPTRQRSVNSYSTLRRRTLAQRRTAVFPFIPTAADPLGATPAIPPPSVDMSDYIPPPQTLPPPPVTVSMVDEYGEPISTLNSLSRMALQASVTQVPQVPHVPLAGRSAGPPQQLQAQSASSMVGIPTAQKATPEQTSELFDLMNLDTRYQVDVAKLEPQLRLPGLRENIEVRRIKMPTELAASHLTDAELTRDVKEERVAQHTVRAYCRDAVIVDHLFAAYAGSKPHMSSQKDNDFFSSRKNADDVSVRSQGDSEINSPLGSPLSSCSGASLGNTNSGGSASSSRRSSMLLSSSPVSSSSVQPVRSSDDSLLKGLQNVRWSNEVYTLKIKSLKSQLMIPDLLFFTVALYDCQRKQKMTEDAFFHVNQSNSLAQLGLQKLSENTVSAVQFGIDAPSLGHVLVIKAYRVFRGESEKDLQSLAKNKTDLVPAKKEIKDWVTKAKTFLPALQPYMWTAFTMFVEAGGRIEPRMIQESDSALIPLKGVLTDENIYDAFNNDLEKTRKAKSLKISLDLELLYHGKDPSGLGSRINSTLVRYDPSFCKMLPTITGSQYAKVLQSFESYPKPYCEHVNNLYIYPDSLSLKHVNPSNLQVSAQLVSATQLLFKKIVPFKSAYPPMFNLSAATMNEQLSRCLLETEAFSSVQWGEKRPQFADELKLALPMQCRDITVLFTFYNVLQPEKRQVVGFSAVKLQRDSTVLRDGQYHLSVYQTLEELVSSDFSKPLSDSDYKKVKYAFSFRSRSMSSVYPQDAFVGKLLSEVYLTMEDDAKPGSKTQSINDVRLRALKQLHDAEPLECSHFLFPLLDALLHALCKWGPELSKAVFEALIDLLNRMHEVPSFRNTDAGNPVLLAWVDIMLDPTQFRYPGKDLYEVFLQNWLKLLQPASSNDVTLADSASEYSWFFLKIISKAATVYAMEVAQKTPIVMPQQFVSSEFQKNVGEMLDTLLRLFTREMKEFSRTQKRLRPINIESVSDFINSVYLFMNRGELMSHVLRFFKNTDPINGDQEVCMVLKFPLLKRLVEYEHYIPLNDPVPFDVRSIDGSQDIPKLFWRCYPLAGIVQQEIVTCIQSEAGVRGPALNLLRTLLRKHNNDKRYQDPAVRCRIATMYFPMVYSVLQDSFNLECLDLHHEHDLFASLIWILTYCSADVINAWWSKDTTKGYTTFFDFLARCVDVFHDQSQLQDTVNITCVLAQRFVTSHKDIINTPKCPVFQKIYDAVITSFEDCSPATLDTVVQAVLTLLRELPEQFFLFPGNSLIDSISCNTLLSWSVLDLSDSQQEELIDLFYQMVTLEFAHTKDTKRVRVQTTLAASRLVGMDPPLDTKRLLDFFSRFQQRVTKGDGVTGDLETFNRCVADIVAKVTPLFNYHDVSAQSDPDLVVDRYYETALAQDENPDQRIAWLQNLSSIHAQKEHWEEAAQCNIFIAVLISRYLSEVCHMQLSLSDFRTLTPNIGTKLGVINIANAQDSGQLQSDVWNFDTLIGVLNEANTFLTNGRHYEQCIEVLSLLTSIWKRERDYARMMDTLVQSTQVCQAMVKEKERDNKVFARYYRVAFYGKCADKLMDREFIYKRPPKCVLSVIQQEIQDFAASMVGGNKERTELLPNRDVDRSTLSPDKIYYQISSVDPIQDTSNPSTPSSSFEAPLPANTANSNKSFDRHFGAHTFVFVQAYGKDGQKAHTDALRDQAKKKTIFETEIAFPFVKDRLEVVSRREIILEPIEHAIELIVERCDKIKEQLQNNPPRLNPLQQVLQGSVAPMVNEGPLKLCETFLSAEARKTAKPEHVEMLTLAMCNFVELCAAAIQLDQMLIGPQHRKFHQMIETYYADLCKKSEVYFVNSKRKPKTSFTADDLDRKVWRDQPRVSLSF